MKLPAYQLKPVSDQRAAHLRSWLQAWQVDQQLRAIDAESGKLLPGEEVSLYVEEARGELPVPGQIRLLQPDADTKRVPRWGPVYVLVLRVEVESARIVPFSRFQSPATPGEYARRLGAPVLSVLSVWQERRVPLYVIERAWPVDAVNAETLAQYVAWTDSFRRTASLPAEAIDQTGPPLVHPADPRWAYLDDEAERLDGALRVREWECVDEDGYEGTLKESRDTFRYLQAAERRETYGAKRREYAIGNSGDVLALVWDNGDTVSIRLFDRHGLPTDQYWGGGLVCSDETRHQLDPQVRKIAWPQSAPEPIRLEQAGQRYLLKRIHIELP